jgi:hypothetical protein
VCRAQEALELDSGAFFYVYAAWSLGDFMVTIVAIPASRVWELERSVHKAARKCDSALDE